MPTRKPISIRWIGVFVLLVAYVGAYHALVSPTVQQINDMPVLTSDGRPLIVPWYRAETVLPYPLVRAFFSPMCWLDHRIRPGVWKG